MRVQPDDALRILLVVKGLDIGGLERYVVSLAGGLTARGHDVEVAVVNRRRRRLVSQLDDAGVKVHLLPGSDRIGVRGARALTKLVRNGSFDVLHVHGPLPAILCRLLPGTPPMVTTSHTPLTALRRSTRLGWRLSSRLDAAQISVSDVVSRSIGDRSTVIRHGVDATRAAPTASQLFRHDEVLAICVASHRPAKNYPNLLRAIEFANVGGATVRLVAIGEGPDLDQHRRLTRELQLDDLVTFELPTADVLPRIAAADLLIVASDWEGQPMVVAEALSMGTPVVSTAVGNVDSMVRADVGRVVATGDHEALGRAIAELAADPDLRRQMSRSALERSDDWTLGDVLDAHERVYRSTARRVTRGPKQ